MEGTLLCDCVSVDVCSDLLHERYQFTPHATGAWPVRVALRVADPCSAALIQADSGSGLQGKAWALRLMCVVPPRHGIGIGACRPGSEAMWNGKPEGTSRPFRPQSSATTSLIQVAGCSNEALQLC